MDTAEKFNRLYIDISRDIQKALKDVAGLHVDNEDGKKHLNTMTLKLQTLQDNFNDKLLHLEKHAVWDKFTLAFFGETNAGKSTIIESLRILFDEESRQQLLKKNQYDLEKTEQELREASEKLRSDLYLLYSNVVDKFSEISFSANFLTQIIENESALRLKMENEESRARLQGEQDERQSRLHILQKQINTKTRLTLFITAIASFAVGSGVVVIINNMMMGQ